MVRPEELAELRDVCPTAATAAEGGTEFVSLPSLKIPVAREIVLRDALLSLGPHTGYLSRLYLSAPVPGRGINWTCHAVLGRNWHTPSWNYVPPGRPIEMLQQHLKVYK